MQLKPFELFRHPYSYCSLCKPLGNPPSARTVSLLQLLSFMLGFRHCCLLLKHSSFTALISIKCFVSFDLPAAVNRDLELRTKSRLLLLRAVWLRLVLRPAGHLSH